MTCSRNRHSASVVRQPAAGIRHSSFVTRHFLFCIAVLAAVAASAAEVAKFVEYIRSDGTSSTGEYILLDYTPMSNSVVETEVAFYNLSQTHNIFCARTSAHRQFTCFYIGNANGNAGFRWDYNETQTYTSHKLSNEGERHTIRCSNTGIELDGSWLRSSTPANFIPANQMMLFASYNTAPPANANYANMKLYSFKAWDEDGAELKVDLRPVIDTEDEPALLDLVTGNLYYNLKAGKAFTPGPEVNPPPEYPLTLTASYAQTNGVWYATVSIGRGSGSVAVLATDGNGATTSIPVAASATAPATFTTALTGLAADATYSLTAAFTSGTDTLTTKPVAISTRIAAVPEAGEAPPSAFTRHIAFAVADGKIPAGTTVSGLPVLVRLSTAIAGFDYGDFALPNGGDLLFTDAAGNTLPHEIDTWDAAGTSFVWVRLPEAAAGTRLLCHYGRAIDPGAATSGIWRDYGGVWHFGEASGTAIDATGNGFDGTPTGYHADALVATAGVIGKARYQPNFGKVVRDEGNRGYMAIPSLRTLSYGDTFTVSMWFKSDAGSWGGLTPRLFHKTDGWIGSLGYNSTKVLNLYGANTSKSFTANTPDLSKAWGHVTLVYSNTTASCYTNGFLSASGTINAAADTVDHLGIGWEPRWAEGYGDLGCRYDELRISGDTPPPERVAAEYAAMADAAFLDCGSVDVTAPAPYCTAPSVASDGNGGFTAAVSLLQGAGTVELLVIPPQGATNVVALSNGAASAPATFTVPLTGLATNTIYALATRATGDHATSVTTGGSVFNGEVTVEKTADATPTSAGAFTVSRPDLAGATNAPLTVAFTLSGTAVAGTHYHAIPTSVTIPAGAATATVEVVTVTEATGATSLTLTLSGGNCLVGDPSSATMSVTSVRDPAALVWAAGTSATELTDGANWTPSVPAVEENDTLSFTGDGESAYRFTMTNNLAVKSFTFANGTSPAVIDFGGHTLSNDTVTTSGSFKQTGTGALTLLNGELDARTFSFQTATFAATNFLLHGNQAFGATTLSFARDGARYLFDKVQFDLTSTWYDKLSFNGWNYEIDARDWNVETPVVAEGNIGNLKFHGTNVNVRLYGTNTVLRGSIALNGRNIRVSVTEGRFYRTGGNSYGTLSMVGDDNELTITNTLRSTCASAFLGFGSARQCTLRVAKGGKYNIWVYDGLTVDARHSFEGTSNLVEVADGTFTINALRIGFVAGAGGDGGNILAVRGDDSTVTFTDGCYVGNTNKLPTRLVFQPGETGFGGAAPIRQTGSGKNIRIAKNTVFEVNAKNFTKARDHGLFTLPLMSFRSNTQAEEAFDTEALANFNRSLVSRPRGGWLTLETSGAYRVLTWNCRKGGTVLLLR